MFSVRIVDADFYVTKPTARLDVLYSEFREANVTRVPVIRIFGSTPGGQKTCLHVHQVFPYIFVPYDGTLPKEKYLKQFATSVDFAIQVALGKATSTTNHVYKTEIVRRIPFYGYHKDEQEFIKIQFYNPRMVAKVVDLLQNGAILNKIFQPYESHIPYLLQFLIDFNLYGMNLLHARKVLFRGWSGIEKKNSQSQTSSSYVSSCNPNNSSSFHTNATSWQYWTENTIPSDLCLGTDIAKTSRCELEVDVTAEDILNQLEIGTSIGRNPGIAAMWEDEKQRRRDHGQPSQISIPISQDRGEMKLLNSEKEFKGRIREIIQERIQMIQSQLEIMEKSLSPEELQEFSQSILLDGKEPCSQSMISQDVDENIPVVDESVIEDVLQASQSQPSSLSGQIDEELVAILLSLADDPNDSEPQECSPKANTSQMIVCEKTESDDDDEESLIMSQPVWNDDDQIEDCESGSHSAEDDDEEDWKPQRIPQLDGPADDDEPLLSNQSTTARASKKKKMGGNNEMKSDDDDDDFRIKKKPKISGNHKNISRTKHELPRRQRKTAIAQLNVLGGNSKHQNRHESCTILSEPATNTHWYRPPVGSEIANWNDGKFPNLELFHQSSKQRTTDKGCLGTGEVGKIRSLVKHKNKDHAKNKGNSHGPSSKNEDMTNIKSRTSKKMKDNLLHLETESSVSQTSDFELRLSDSSSDGEDFKCKKKVSKITAGDLKHECFYVAKQSPVKSRLSKDDNSKYKKCKARNTELLDKDAKLCSLKSTIISQNRKSSSRNQTRISKKSYSASRSPEQGCEVGAPGNSSVTHSEKDTEKSRNDLESRKRKRTRSKKATCLMFTHVDNQNKADKLNLSKTGTSRKSDKCSFAKTDYDKPEMRSKLSITSHDLTIGVKECPRNERNNIEDKKENECSIHRNSRNSKEIKNESKISKDVKKENQASVSGNSGNREVKNESKFRKNRIMLDACIRLEKISVKELKSKNNKANVLEHSSQDVKDIVSLAVEMNDDTRNSKDFVIDDELDSLYQMATLSPRSVRSDVHSPPLSSSPSLNSHEQSLDNSLFPGKGDGLDKEINMSKGYSKKHFNSRVPSLSDKDKRNADTKFTHNQITLDNDVDANVFSMKPTTVDFPIKFVSEEEVKSIACQSVSASKEHIGKEFTACANSFNDSLSPGISAVCDSSSNGDEAGSCMDIREREVEICRDMDIMSPGISAVCDSFSSEEQLGLDIQEILKDIENPRVFGGQESSGETNIDMNRVVKDDESPYVSKDQNLPGETYSESHHDSQKTDHIKTTTTLHEVHVEDDLVVKFSDKLDTLDTDGSMNKCHSMSQTTIQSHHDSEKNDHTKMTTSLHKVDDEDDLVVTFSGKLDTLNKDGSTDKCHSMSQTTIQSHHDSEKNDHTKMTTSLHKVDDEDDLVVTFSGKLDTLDKDGSTDKCHSMPQTTIQSHHDSEKNDHFKMTTSLHKVDDEYDLVVTFSDKLDTFDKDGSTDKCHSMPQTTIQSHHDSEKHDHTKMTTSLHKVDDEDDLVVTFSDKLDTFDKDGSTDKCHSMSQTTIQSHHDSEKNDHTKMTTSLHKVDDEDDLVVTFSDKFDTFDKDGSTDKCHSLPQTTIESHHDSKKDDHSKIWRPATEAPSPSYVLETRRLYGLPHERHQKAFCSDPKDIPSVARVIGGRRLQVSSLSVDELPEFDLGGSFQTLHEFRRQTGDHMDNSLLRDCLRSLDIQSGNDGYIGVPRELKLALMGDHQVIITPVILPPSPKDVRKWMKERRSGNQLTSQSQEPEVVGNYISQGLEKNTFPDEAELSNIPRDENSEKSPKDDNTEILVSRKSSVVTHSPKLADRTLDLREISQPTQGVSQSISRDVLFGPQHSTPVGNPGMKSRKFWQCTPVEGDEAKLLKQDPQAKISSEDKSCKIKSLRRNILNSQVKECDSQDHHRPSAGEASYIEGPTPTNSFGFKISQPNIQDAKSVRQVQFLTLLSVELHVRTRKTLCPDPEFDPICAIFYHIEHETTQGKKYETGIIVVRNESTKLRSSDTSSVSAVNASTSMQASHHGTSNKTSYEDSLLRHAGISNELNILTEHQETDAINRFIKLVHDWDPDILLGFEVQMLSLGYLIQRASALGIDLAPQLSRVQDSSGTARFNAEKDKWGANHTSEISITGRIVLNVWRLMRHEVTLNVYSFENISYHVLHERIPLYTYRQLTRWWDHKLPHDRWRTVEHYILRCQGNIKILNHVDFINRTSEFARLFGILFYSVISRGSQFRVESMMLRLAKPMNYLAVSPSIQQRARMDAPECIPLVMEPESRFYSDPVIVLDFQSLYPSMMIAYNYCFSTCLGKVSRLDKIGNFDFGCTSLNVPPALLEKLEDDIHVSANGSAFVKPHIRKGILPRMVEEILDTRVMVKKAMKEHKNDKILGQLLDARQLGLKLIANVTYGYTSANFSGRMPCVEIADAIVRKARETLERAIHLVNSKKEWGARVVYGDTDSLFVLVKGATKEEAFQIGKEIVDAVTAENPKPVKLKFEKVYLPCVLQTKKRYVGYMYETLEQKEPVFDAKGIETVRRDTCPAVAKILEKSLRILFEEKDISLVKKFVQRQFRKLMEERVSIQDFIFAKEYRGMKGYKPTACVPALELARRQLSRDRRAEPRVGERVPYVVVNGSPGLPLIQLVRSPGDVLNDASLRLNSSYYINKQIIPPLNRVFSLIGIDIFTWYTELPRYLPRHHVNTGKQKSSISRFFTTLHCPVCEQLTQQGLCRGCRDNPQKAVVILAERVGIWERKYNHLTEMCFQCCGTRDAAMTCISLDCPVMFKRIKMRRKLEYGDTLRDVQKGIQVTNR